MRKSHIAALLIVVATATGCRNARTAKIDGLEIERLTVDTAVYIAKGASPKCRVSMDVEYAEGKNAQKVNGIILNSGVFPPEYIGETNAGNNIKECAKRFADTYIACYRNDFAPLISADKRQAAMYERNMNFHTYTASERDNILTYTAVFKEMSGDGSASTQTHVVNIDTQAMRRIGTGDMLMHGSDTFVKRAICKALCKKFGARDIAGLRKKGILANEEVYVPDNFIIGRHHITFIFDSDEIAPHDIGEIRVTIDDSEFGKLLKLKQ